MKNKILISPKQNPLIAIERIPFDLSKINFQDAQKELFKYAEENATLVWGYYTSLNQGDQKAYPHCIRMAEQLQELVNQIDPKLQLAFIRASRGKQVSTVGGLHVDSHVDGRPIQDPNRKSGEEVLRVLINFGNHSRTLGYSDASLEEIEQQGGMLTEMGYIQVDLPESLTMKTVDLPPREKDAVWVLKFWASQTPHTGIDDENGHLLVAYGRYADPEKINL